MLIIEERIRQVESRDPFTVADARELGKLMAQASIAQGNNYLGVGHDFEDDGLEDSYQEGVNQAFADAGIERD